MVCVLRVCVCVCECRFSRKSYKNSLFFSWFSKVIPFERNDDRFHFYFICFSISFSKHTQQRTERGREGERECIREGGRSQSEMLCASCILERIYCVIEFSWPWWDGYDGDEKRSHRRMTNQNYKRGETEDDNDDDDEKAIKSIHRNNAYKSLARHFTMCCGCCCCCCIQAQQKEHRHTYAQVIIMGDRK